MYLNWIDGIILIIFIFFLVDGWKRGFFVLVVHLISLLLSFWLALRYHGIVAHGIVLKFGLMLGWSDVISYLIVAVVSQICIEMLCLSILQKIPVTLHTSKINSIAGSIVSGLNVIIAIAFALLLISALPFRGTIRSDIQQSVIGSALNRITDRFGGQTKTSVESLAKNLIKFLTVEPGSNQSIPLNIPIEGILFTVDTSSELQMVRLVNKERTSRGLPELVIDQSIVTLAEEKSKDMFVRRYFSHYDPDGKSAGDRFRENGIANTMIGENLAYAPDVNSAHIGFMNSEGHRINILEQQFHRIGIGIIDGGLYGKMFTQEFAD